MKFLFRCTTFLLLLLPQFASANHNTNTLTCRQDLVYSGWYCDVDYGEYAVDCAYDLDTDSYFPVDSIDCLSQPNAFGCAYGDCSCVEDCYHSGILNKDCSCSCSGPWVGELCDVCGRSDSECANGGTIDPANCGCSCPSTCANGGTRGTDCDCTCKTGWGGDLCTLCTRSNSECTNGGYMNIDTCACSCPNTCQNGGTQATNCACTCPSPWTGNTCTTCTRSDSECANGGTMDPATCTCSCPSACAHGGSRDANCNCSCEAPWEGATCDTCSISPNECINSGSLDQVNCRCDCPTGCMHGGTRSDTCQCSCPEPWTGEFCQTCGIQEVECNGGTLNRDTCSCECPQDCEHGGDLSNTCECTCPSPWVGDHCETCGRDSGHCENDGTIDPTICSCDCTNAKDCQHGTRKTDGTCGCKCEANWTGKDCSQCGRQESFCQNGGALDAEQCTCDCSQSQCVHGTLGENCECTCEQGYEGTDCAKKIEKSAAMALHPSSVAFATVLGVFALTYGL